MICRVSSEVRCPNPQIRKYLRDSTTAFDVALKQADPAPSVLCLGMSSQITGTRADLLIADDIETPENTMTQLMRDRLSETVKEFGSIRKTGGDEIKTIYLGTPHTEDTIYRKLEERGYTVRIWPARYPDRELCAWYGGRLSPDVQNKSSSEFEGKPTDTRFTEFELAERELEYGGRSAARLQFMLDYRMSDAMKHPLKLQDLIIHDIDMDTAPEKIVWASSRDLLYDKSLPNVGFDGDYFYRPLELIGDHIPYSGTVMSIDPSGRGKDETGYAVVKMLNGFLYVIDAGGISGGYDEEALETLSDIAFRNKVNRIVIESNFGDGMFMHLFKPILFRKHECNVEEVRHNIQKEKRIIDTLEPVMNRHRLVVDPKVIRKDMDSVAKYSETIAKQYMLFYQLSHLTKDKGSLVHDDRLDALSMAVAYWTDRMNLDENKQMEKREWSKLKQKLSLNPYRFKEERKRNKWNVL